MKKSKTIDEELKNKSPEELLNWFIKTENNRKQELNTSTHEKGRLINNHGNDDDEELTMIGGGRKGTKTHIHIDEHTRTYTQNDVPPKRFQTIKVKVKPISPHPLIYFVNCCSQKEVNKKENERDKKEEIMHEISTEFLKNNEYVIHKETCLLLSNLNMKELICEQIIELIFYSKERTILFALKMYQLFVVKLHRLLKNYYVNESSSSLNILRAYEFFINAFNSEHHSLTSPSSLLSDDDDEMIIDNDNDDNDNVDDDDNKHQKDSNVRHSSSLKTPKLKRNEDYISFVRKTVMLQWKIICLTPWGLKNAKLLQNHFPYHVLAIINLMKDGGKSQIIKDDKKIQIIPSSNYTSKYWLPLNDLTHLGFQKKLITDAMNHFTKAYNSILFYKLPIPMNLIEETVQIAL